MIRLRLHTMMMASTLLVSLSLLSPAYAAKKPQAEPAPVQDTADTPALDELLGKPNGRYIASNLIPKNGNYDYRSVTTLPEFERYSSKDRWKGNSATALLKSMKEFHGVRGSTALRTMWRHILLSDFKGLEFDSKEPNVQQVALFTQRLKVLNALGYFDEAVRLYQIADTNDQPIPASVTEQAIESMALAGSADGACLEVNLALGSLRSSEWLQDGALCAAYFGQTNKADALYKVVENDAGDGFRTIFRMLRDNNTNGRVQIDIPPLWRTLLLAKGAGVGFDSLKKLTPSDLASIAVNRHVPFGTRLAAGEKAAAAGSISSDQLRKLYDEQGKPDDAQLNSMLQQIKDGTGLSRARTYQAARFIFAGNDRATIVQKAIKSLPNVNSSLGGVYHWIIVKLTLQKDAIAWFAPTGYVVLTGGNRGDAKYYYEYGKLDGHYVSFLRLFHDIKYGTPEFFIKWRKDIAKTFPKDGLWRIDTGMAIARMLGVSDETLTGTPVVKGKNGPATPKRATDSVTDFEHDSAYASFQQAVDKHERGNGVVAALNLYASRPWRQFSPSFFSTIFSGLNKIGAKGENLKISIEIAMQTVI